jgi:TRAP-type uncharacterized transport system fused permease subunit
VESLKLAASTFIIPFAFVYRPQLLDFPNVGWNVLPPLVEVLLVQWVTSIALYGYFLRPIGAGVRTLFLALMVLGYWAMVTEAVHSTFVFTAAVVVLLTAVALRGRAKALVSKPQGGET